MDLITQEQILVNYKKSLHWQQQFLLKHSDEVLDLSVSVGPAAVTPENAPDQPYHFDFTSKYRFSDEFDSEKQIDSLRLF